MRYTHIKPIAILCALAVAPWALAQTDVEMFAATANVNGRPQVRLRWQFTSGWIPESGIKVYRVTEKTRTLVRAIDAPSEASVDALFPAQFKGKKLWTAASRPLPGTVRLDFGIVRPPSSLPIFEQRKTFLDTIRVNPGPMTPEQRRNFSALFASPGSTRPTANRTAGAAAAATSASQKPTEADLTKAARSELQLIALVKPNLADNLALGLTDTDVKSGEKVTYELAAAGARGTETVLATVRDFVVGSDPQPPTPQGFKFLQDDETIGMRWDRLSAQDERRFLQASYEISRIDTANGPARDLTAKPIVILSLEGNREPVSFFADKVSSPGQVTYKVSLIDGFGRASQPGTFTFTVAEWRKPEPPAETAASLGLAFRNSIHAGRTKTGQPTLTGAIQAAPQATIVWRPAGQQFQLPVRFNVYRFDLDNPSAAAVKLTLSPIEGTAMPADTEAQVVEVATLLYADRLQRLEDAIDAAQARPAGPARDRAVALAEAKKKAFFAALGGSLKANPAVKFVDGTATRDKRFSYSVSAVFTSISMESADVAAGVLSIPDATPPPAVSGITQKFTPAPAFKRVFEPVPQRSKVSQFSARIIQDRIAERRKAPQRSTAVENRLPVKLSLTPNDDGGTVELSWSPLSNLRDVRYQVRRTLGNQTVEVGVTKPNTPTIRDTVPRTRARTYRYEITPISRWNVAGAKSALDVLVPATAQPDVPNVLSARPGADGQIKVTIEAHAADQGVAKYVVMRDGQPAGTVNWAATGRLEFVDSGLAPNAPHTYVLRAETAAGTKSLESAPLKCSAVKLTAAAPTSLQAVSEAQGVRLTWTAATGATTYIVKRQQGSGPLVVLAGKVSGTTFVDVMAMRGQSYSYEVYAVDAAGNVSAAVKKTVAVP
jgi:fibronectin type 3 domain-containing protein